MTRFWPLQPDNSVDEANGESANSLDDLGLGLPEGQPEVRGRNSNSLALHCPHCRRTIRHPGLVADGALALAECVACDALFSVAGFHRGTPAPETQRTSCDLA